MIGQTLSHFKITAKLGEGGMGEVYRAEDGKLGREVAIKVLPEAFTEDLERLARFEREARVLASLNHKNIAAIHEVGEEEGVHFLVMELVEGEDLAARLDQGALSVEATLSVALQIAEGLEAAHSRGIVHRDLKPGNIRLTQEGQVKILDFGLAKSALSASEDTALTHSPTLTAQMTQAGVILGTAAYMSPEQARGEEADHRADIWGFGVVLFEMLTGSRPFPGGNLTDLLAEIVKGEVEWGRLPANTPRSLARLLRRCLVKDRAQRLQAIGDARIEIQTAVSGQDDQPLGTLEASGGPGLRSRLFSGIALAALVALATWWVTGRSSSDTSPPLRRTLVAIPELSRLGGAAISPEGDRIAFVGDSDLWLHDLTEMASRRFSETAGATVPFWSPDGQWIGYFDRMRVLKIAASGGAPVPLATLPYECPALACSGSWTDDGRILIGTGMAGLLAVPEGGGAPTSYLEPEEDEHFHEVAALPGGRGAIFYVDPDGDENRLDLMVDEQRIRGPLGAAPAYSSDDFLIFQRSDGLWAAQFDPTEGGALGEPFLLLPGAQRPSLSRDGTLLAMDPRQRVHQLVWVDRQGVIREAIDEIRDLAIDPVLSPDGSRIAFVSIDAGRGLVMVLDPARGTRQQLTPSSTALNFRVSPGWGADGRTLLGVEPGPTGTDTEEVVITRAALDVTAFETLVQGFDPVESQDGRYLVFSVNDFNVRDIHYLDLLEPDAKPRVFLAEPGYQGNHELSPDGQFIAFLHSNTGMTGLEVYLSSFPGGGSRVQVSSGGLDFQTQIRWRGDGKRLYYTRSSDGMLMEVEVDLTDEPELATPVELFSDTAAGLDLSTGFDVAANGERFVVTRATVPIGGDRGGWMLIQNWRDLLPESR